MNRHARKRDELYTRQRGSQLAEIGVFTGVRDGQRLARIDDLLTERGEGYGVAPEFPRYRKPMLAYEDVPIVIEQCQDGDWSFKG
jgi:hypothetical protein